MPSERETFIKVSDHMPWHPKVMGLSDKAFRALVTLWCYCSQYRTDGVVADAVWRQYAPAKASKELVAAGLAYVTDNGASMHDYLDRQRSREQIEAVSAKRAEAGQRGGKVKPTKKQTPKQNASGVPSNGEARPTPDNRAGTTYLPDRRSDSAPTERRGDEPRTDAQRANALADVYYDAVGGECSHQGTAKIVRKCLDNGRRDDDVRDALLRLVEDRRPLTSTTLRAELDGPPAARARQSTSDAAAMSAQTLKRPVRAAPDSEQSQLPTAGGF